MVSRLDLLVAGTLIAAASNLAKTSAQTVPNDKVTTTQISTSANFSRELIDRLTDLNLQVGGRLKTETIYGILSVGNEPPENTHDKVSHYHSVRLLSDDHSISISIFYDTQNKPFQLSLVDQLTKKSGLSFKERGKKVGILAREGRFFVGEYNHPEWQILDAFWDLDVDGYFDLGSSIKVPKRVPKHTEKGHGVPIVDYDLFAKATNYPQERREALQERFDWRTQLTVAALRNYSRKKYLDK